MDREGPGKVLEEAGRSIVMGRGREPQDRQHENSGREEGDEGWGVKRLSREPEMEPDRRGDKLTVSEDTDVS